MISRIFRRVLALALVFIMIVLVLVNVSLNYRPQVKRVDNVTINIDLMRELRGLKQSIDGGADVDMQRLYPEGYVFLNAIYALAWCNFLDAVGDKGEYFWEGHTEIQNAWDRINSDHGHQGFTKEMPLTNGAFYTGWSTYLLGRKLALESSGDRIETEVGYFKQQCDSIMNAIGESTYPQTYNGDAWPADVVLCVAALSLHDKLFETKYKEAITHWISKVRSTCDSRGLIPHSVHPSNGTPLQNSRGSSQSLMLIFLRDIDQTFANEQFELFRNEFVDTKFGLIGVREYAKDESGIGDVDSGPVVLGFGAAAMIVGMQTLSLYGEDTTALSIRNTIEVAGLPIKRNGQKEYLFAALPIADAFIAWSHTAPKMADPFNLRSREFHAYSIGLFALLAVLFWFCVDMRNR